MTTAITSASKPETVYYSSPANPRFQPITAATRFPPHVVAQCLSFLFPSTIAEFVDYFRTSNALVIPADQPFSIRDISLILGNRSERSYPKDSTIFSVAPLLRSLLAPLGKGLRLETADSVNGSCSDPAQDDDLFFLYDRDVTLTAGSFPAAFRLTDLYRLMKECSIPEVTFASGQDVLIWGLSAEECNQELVEDTLPKLVFSRRLSGMRLSFSYGDHRLNPIFAEDGSYGFKLHKAADFTLKISVKSFHTFDTADELEAYLKVFPELVLKAGEVVTIVDERVSLCREAHALMGEFNHFCRFVLDQMLVQLGMSFDWYAPSDEFEVNTEREDDEFSVQVDKPVTLVPVFPERVRTTLQLLSHGLIHSGRESFSLRKDQELNLFGLTQGEIAAFNAQCNRRNLRNLFPFRNPTGFVWSIRYNEAGFRWDSARCLFRKSDEKKFPYFAIIPNEEETGLQLVLDRVNGEELIANLVLEMHPGFLQELHDMDPAALNFLLLRAFIYYCCDDFRYYQSHELPDFFKEGTAESIAALLVNPEFKQACQKLKENPNYVIELRRICLRSTAAEFEALDRTELPQPLQVIFKMISQISNVGTQRAPLFLTRDLPNFLAKNPVPKAADKPAAASDKPASAAVDSKDPKK